MPKTIMKLVITSIRYGQFVDHMTLSRYIASNEFLSNGSKYVRCISSSLVDDELRIDQN